MTMIKSKKLDDLKKLTGELFITERIESEFEKRGYKQGSVTVEFLPSADIDAGFIYLTGNGEKPDYLDADAYIIRLTANDPAITSSIVNEIVKDIPELKESVITFELSDT